MSVSSTRKRKTQTETDDRKPNSPRYVPSNLIDSEEPKSSLRSTAKGSDDFWAQLEGMLAKHESQMEILAQKAVEKRTSLSNERKIANTEHLSRMKKATEELEVLRKEIMDYQSRVEDNQADVLEAKEAQIREAISDTNAEIEQVTRRVTIIRNSSKQLREKLEESRANADRISSELADRKRRIEEREAVIGDEINETIARINDIEDELSALETKEMACTALYARLQKDLPIAQRIFGNL